jgi:hypothetical protein
MHPYSLALFQYRLLPVQNNGCYFVGVSCDQGEVKFSVLPYIYKKGPQVPNGGITQHVSFDALRESYCLTEKWPFQSVIHQTACPDLVNTIAEISYLDVKLRVKFRKVSLVFENC